MGLRGDSLLNSVPCVRVTFCCNIGNIRSLKWKNISWVHFVVMQLWIHSSRVLHLINWIFGLLICQFVIILVQTWCFCSTPVFIFLECWSLSSFFVMTNFFYVLVNLHHFLSLTQSCFGYDGGLNWTFERCFACLNILCLPMCIVIFLVPNVVKVLQRMLNFSVLWHEFFPCILFPMSIFYIHIPW